MAKREDVARAIQPSEQTNNLDSRDQLKAADERAAASEPVSGVSSTDKTTPMAADERTLANERTPGHAGAASEAAALESDHIQATADPAPRSACTDIVTVSFAQAEADWRSHCHDAERSRRPSFSVRRCLPFAATIMVATAIGAVSASFTMRLVASDDDGRLATLQENRVLKETIAKIGTDVATLKTNVETSAKSANAQFARVGERLDRADRAQVESTGKLAKLTESIERRAPVAVTAAAAPATSGAASDVTGSVSAKSVAAKPVSTGRPLQLSAPATRPAGQPIVEGWTLRDVVDGAAIIQGRIGLVEVAPGDSLPSLGRIEAIRRLDGRWVVVTNRGLIIAR